MVKFTPKISIANLEAAINHAEARESKAEKSSDAQDFVAAETAYSDAAHIAHIYGTNEATSKPERDEAYNMGVALNKLAAQCKKRSEDIIHQSYVARKEKWSAREQLTSSGAPPQKINVLDQHGGFTAETTKGGTLWRPGDILKSAQGTLVDYNSKSFFQNNNDVTKATYKVAGYRYPVIVWFDNKTGRRVA